MNHKKLQRMTGLSLFTAIIVVLQLLSTFVRFGPFSITLALIPIVVGAAIYGPGAGAFLGGVFGLVTLIASAFGWDAGGSILWNTQPLLTALICLVKGAAAGFVAGGAFRLLGRRHPAAGTAAAAILSPVVNTGLFLLALYALFPAVLAAWASDAGADVATYILTGLVGVNFLVEMAVNLVLSPVIHRVVRAKLES